MRSEKRIQNKSAGIRFERDRIMDDLYAINAAKTEFREGFNLGDVLAC